MQPRHIEGAVPQIEINFNAYTLHCCDIFISLSLALGPSHSPSFIKRHGSACNLASIGVSTKLILSNPRGVNPFAYGRSAVERMQAQTDG